MTFKQTPEDWGWDALSKFIDISHANSLATFVNLRTEYDRLRDVHVFFMDLIPNLANTPDWFCGFFLLKAHCSFLAAARLAISAQAAETYIVLRGCLENALYSFYFQHNPKSAQRWLARKESEEDKRRFRKEFTIAAMFRCLSNVNEDIYSVAKRLYDRTIDYGGIPMKMRYSPK